MIWILTQNIVLCVKTKEGLRGKRKERESVCKVAVLHRQFLLTTFDLKRWRHGNLSLKSIDQEFSGELVEGMVLACTHVRLWERWVDFASSY